jgi:hypothetical protein
MYYISGVRAASQSLRTPALSISYFYVIPSFLSKEINDATSFSYSWFSVECTAVNYRYTRKLLQNEDMTKAYMSHDLSCKQKTQIKEPTVQGT